MARPVGSKRSKRAGGLNRIFAANDVPVSWSAAVLSTAVCLQGGW
jgi:hypothetical protein